MVYTRRDVVRMGLITLPLAELIPAAKLLGESGSKPNSRFNGVQIGVIISPYNFAELPVPADKILKNLVQMGINAVEMQDVRVEASAGAPGTIREGYSGSKLRMHDNSTQSAAERAAARQKAAEELKQWRLSAPMEKFRALRKMYDDAGVQMYAFRVGNVSAATSGAEYDYFFQTAKILGANQITMELPEDPNLSQTIGDFAAKHKIVVGYHNHLQVNDHSWDTALAQSKWNGINLDVGHFTAAINGSPIPFIKQHSDRITCVHLKDRKYRSNGGQNMPWGQGDTPLKEVLELMKTEKYQFPAGIELEYHIPEGSSASAEIVKCVQFCKEALA